MLFKEDNSKEANLKAKLEELGFSVLENIENQDNYKGFKFMRIDKPFYYDIDELTLYLIELLDEFNANYDGWECDVVKA